VYRALANDGVMKYHPSARGMRAAREAVSLYYSGRVRPDSILLTASTSEAYSYLFKLLCEPEDEILVPRPSYPLFDMLARLECARVRQYPLRYQHGWFIDVPALRAALTNRTRAIVWVNPNNPTGSYMKSSEYEAISLICAEHGLALISDEVFADYALEAESEMLLSLADQDRCLCFSLSGLSKVCGMPQMKLGWIAASGPGHELALERLEWIADAFLSVGTPVQCAAPELLEARHSIQTEIRERTKRNLQVLQQTMRNSAVRVLQVEGGWYATLRVPSTRSEEAWTLELLRGGVLVQPGFFFDFETEAYLVVSLLTEPDVFSHGVRYILGAC
jgi:aspartate/methionine/tyrosine aminotransferase